MHTYDHLLTVTISRSRGGRPVRKVHKLVFNFDFKKKIWHPIFWPISLVQELPLLSLSSRLSKHAHTRSRMKILSVTQSSQPFCLPSIINKHPAHPILKCRFSSISIQDKQQIKTGSTDQGTLKWYSWRQLANLSTYLHINAATITTKTNSKCRHEQN